MSRRRKSPLPTEPVAVTIESLSHAGRGVVHINGKTVFIDGALPGEEVTFLYQARHRRYDEGCVVEIINASADRTTPLCRHFERCGGCALQHMSSEAQIALKQQTLLDNLQRIGKVMPEQILEPLTGPIWGYRRKARLGVRFVIKKSTILVGFREKRSSFITEIDSCPVLFPTIGNRISVLRELIAGMKAFDQIPQLEVAVGDNAISIIVRHLADLAAEDRDRLVEFGKHYDIHIYLQPEGVGSVYPLWPDKSELFYCLEDYGIEMHFRPTDFTQVNADINRRMVPWALGLLAVERSDRVLDLFSGIGNFSLPLARIAASVVGVEGDAGLVKRARDNASRNGIENVEFHVEDLAGESRGSNIMKQPFDKVLLDPPRTGAAELISDVAGLGAKRVVYVSCNPATLARDAGELVNGYRYRLRSAGVMDMFPHTAHVEAIALFER